MADQTDSTIAKTRMRHLSDDSGIAVIIATRNRPAFLKDVVTALEHQSLRPHIVVIADSSDENDAYLNRNLLVGRSLNIQYLATASKSLTRQKNLAIRTSLEIDAVQFIQILDDDTVPDSDHLLTLRDTLMSLTGAVGVSGITLPRWSPPNTPRFIRAVFKFFGLDSDIPGSVTAAGIGIPIDTTSNRTQRSDWLYGCSMWRRFVFQRLEYEPDFVGSALFEDVEFSTRARALGELFVNPRATLNHNVSEIGRPDSRTYAYRFVRNRLRVIRNLGTKRSILAYPLSTVLQMLVYLTKSSERRSLIQGTLRGLVDEVRRRPLL
jgi:GT2 family glycosyltransferase